MKKPFGILGTAAVAAICMAGAVGCQSSQTASNDETTSGATPAAQATMGAAERTGRALDIAGANAKQNARDAAAETGEAMHNAGQDIKTDARHAGAAVGNAASDVSKSSQNAMAPMVLTPKVKTALGADKQLDGSDINVDTRADSRQVVLSGTVTSASQKAIASKVALNTLKANKSNFAVKNDLVVSGSAASAK